MSGLFLSDDDIVGLTGFKRKADQRRWLDQRNYIYELAAGGRPVVLLAHVTQKMNGAIERDPVTMNLAAIRRRA